MKYKIVDKKRFAIFCSGCVLLTVIFFGGGFLFYRWLKAPEVLALEKIEGAQEAELRRSLFEKNLEMFKFENEEEKKGDITLTTFDEKESGSKESHFIFAEDYAKGHKFSQGGLDFEIIPQNIEGLKFKRKVASDVEFSDSKQKNSGQFVFYEGERGEKHIFALSRKENTLKQWDLYQEYQPQISEKWELKGTVLRQLEDGTIEVYKQPVKNESLETTKNLDSNMAARIEATLKEELGEDYYYQKNNFLFSIPKPYYMGKNGEQKDAQVIISDHNVLEIKVEAAKDEFPILIDPTITLARKMNYLQINGDAASDNLGTAVASAGDVNGDGLGDVIVGAYNDDDGGSASGCVFIFYGGTKTTGSATTRADVKLTGDAASDQFGYSVSVAGDMNGDGLDDVIVGAPYDDDGGSASGSAFIFYGGVTSGAATTKANVKLTGDNADDAFGYAVSSAGDVNGDGLDDVIVGAYMDDDGYTNSGSAFVFYGGVSSGSATAQSSVKITGDASSDNFGSRVSSAGDMNGDGLDDFIAASVNNGTIGAAYFFYGGTTSGTASAKANVIINGDSAFDYFGSSVSSAGDVNGDGLSDVIVGAYGDDDGGSESGSAFIFYGGVTSGAATTKASVKITGDSASDRFGRASSGGGDINGDGKSDFIVGAYQDDDGGSNSGSAFIFYGGVTSGAATTKADIKLIGDSASDSFGVGVSLAGDVNGDGKDDIIVGASGDDDGGGASGSAKIYTFNDFQNSVKLTGDSVDDNFGLSVASAGDVNGDGLSDVIVGAYQDDDGASNSGSAFIFYGGVTSGAATAKANVKLTGDSADDWFGQSAASAGDVNGDGLDDVIVGAYQDDDGSSGSGSAFIFYGGVTSGAATSKANVKLTGDSANDGFGFSVASAGDVNGDGKGDVIVGALNDDDGGSNSGSAFIFYGGVTSGTATTKANAKLTGDSDSDAFGRSVSSAGDVNGDGLSDVIVSTPYDDDGGSNSGSAFIFYGGVTSGAATAKANVKLTGDAAGDYFGESSSSAGDVNGDGLDDVIVGAVYDDDGGSMSGSAFIFYGGVTSGAATAKANVKLTGDAASDYFGESSSSAGDVNGDGLDDVIVGAYQDDDGGADSGSAFIFYGGVTSGAATTKANIKLTGDAASDNFGRFVSSAGDVNGDGKADIIVGAWQDDDGGSNSGSTFIFTLGPSGKMLQYNGDSASDSFGYAVSSAGDVNGDGKDDVIVGAYQDDDGGSASGSAFVFYGGGLDGAASSKADVKITGDSAGDNFGYSVSFAGDVNGDGKDDFIVGAPYDDDGSSGSGSAFVFYGGVTSGGATSQASVKITGDSADDALGISVSGGGDINLDGKSDFVVGAYMDDDGGDASGSIFVFYGGVTSGTATSQASVKLTGDAAGDLFGCYISSSGDINGDGKSDVVAGAYADDDGGSNSGSAFIFYGGVTSGAATTQASVKLTGDSATDYFGKVLSFAGDVNGDGKDDVIVGAYADDDGGAASGSAFIFYGGVTSGAATTKASVKLTGDSAADNFGTSVSAAGDVNGDGKDDVIVGAPFDDDVGTGGSAFIFYGGVSSGSATDKADVKLIGDGVGDNLGNAVACAGDVNGDGKDDVIVGAYQDDDGGNASGSAKIFTSVAIKNNPDSPIFQLNGDAADDNFGYSVASAGDVNGDGFGDVIVGAYQDDDGGSASGSAFIFYGGVASGAASTKANVKIIGDAAGDSFGYSVSSAGDVNGDGKDDVVVGAFADDDAGVNSGSAFIFYGGVTSGSATSKANIKLTGDSLGDYFGYSVSSAGDVNGDGKDDVIVGAEADDDGGSNSGSAFVFYGGVTSGAATTQASIKIIGDAASDYFGISVASAGDVNGDGKDDVIVGAYQDDDGGSDSGSAFIFYGGVTSGAATTRANVKLTGDSGSDYFGYSVSSAGDVNGDGKDDVIVGAYQDDDGGEDSGSAFIFYGGVTSGVATAKANVKLTGDAAGDYFGKSVSFARDVNGDDRDDVIVGAYADDDGGSESGSAFIFYGGVTSGAATTKASVKLIGDSAADNFGTSVSSAGDLNGDGKDDVIVGAYQDDDGGSNSGSARIIYGHRISPEMPTTLTPASGTYTYGQSVSIVCSGGTYNTTKDKYGQTIARDVQAFYGGSWNDVVAEDADGSYSWSVNNIPNEAGVKLRCRNSITGLSGGFSRWLEPIQTGLTIIQGGVKVEGSAKIEGGIKME